MLNLMRAVSEDSINECIDDFIDCIKRTNGIIPNPLEKAKVLAFLASRERIKMKTGHAARANYWKFENDAYYHINKD